MIHEAGAVIGRDGEDEAGVEFTVGLIVGGTHWLGVGDPVLYRQIVLWNDAHSCVPHLVGQLAESL